VKILALFRSYKHKNLLEVYNAPTDPLTEFWVALMGLTEKLQNGKDEVE